MAGPVGARSGVKFGVGGDCWLGGVAGGRDSVISMLREGLATYSGLEGSTGRLAEGVRECVGGVGGGSGPLPTCRGCCGREELDPDKATGCAKGVSLPRLYFRRPDRCGSSFRGCGRTLCFLNMRGWLSKTQAAWGEPMLGSMTLKSPLVGIVTVATNGRFLGSFLDAAFLFQG